MNTKVALVSCLSVIATLWSLVWRESTWGAGDPVHGATIFQTCAACHSTTPGEQLTGPSLANIGQRKAGTVEATQRLAHARGQSHRSRA
jgi:cytochrome c2